MQGALYMHEDLCLSWKTRRFKFRTGLSKQRAVTGSPGGALEGVDGGEWRACAPGPAAVERQCERRAQAPPLSHRAFAATWDSCSKRTPTSLPSSKILQGRALFL